MNTWLKRGIYALFLLPLIVLASTAFIVAFHQEAIVQKAVEAANSQFVGRLTIENSKVSLFAGFPYISINLRGVAFFENKAKDTKPFYKARNLYLGFNLWDIIGNDFKVKSIRISDGHADLVRYPGGEINVLLAKGIGGKGTGEDNEVMSFNLAKVEISNFMLSYEDLSDSASYLLYIDNWKSSIRHEGDTFAFNLKGDVTLDLLRHGKPTFFSDKQINLDLNLNFDNRHQVLTLDPSSVRLEDALFASSGKINLLEKGMSLDMRLEGQKPDFKIIQAFLPKDAAAGLNNYKNQGEVYFKGTVIGLLGDGHTPAITAEFGCENAFFLRAENDLKVDELRFFGFFTNGVGRNLSTSELHIQNFNAKPEHGIFQGDLSVRNFEDPYIKVKLNADLDLEFVGAFFQLERFEGISGQILLNMDFDELVDLDASNADLAKLKKSVQSELILKDLNFGVSGYKHPIQQLNATAFMREGEVILSNVRFQIKDSDFAFNGRISDFPALFHRFEKDVTLSLEAKSQKIDLGQLLSSDGKMEKITDLTAKISLEAKAAELMDFRYLPEGRLVLDGFEATLQNYPHSLKEFKAAIRIGEKTVDIEKLAGKIDQSDFLLKATLDNYPKWFQEELAGESSINWLFQSEMIHISDLLTYNGVNYLPEAWREEVFSSLDIRGKADLYFHDGLHSADLHLEHLTGRTRLHPLTLEQFNGSAKWEKDYLSIRNFGGKMGRSEFSFDLGLNLQDSVKTSNDYFHLRAAALDLDALLGFKGFEEDTNHAEAFNIFQLPFRNMEFTADIRRLNYHSKWLQDVLAKARISTDHFLYVDTLGIKVAKGSIGFKGYLNGSNPEEIYLHAELEADRLNLDELLFKFETFQKDVMINENLKGSISGSVSGKFLVYPDLTPIIDKSEAKMALTVYEGSLVDFAPFSALSDYFSERNLNLVRFDTLSNTFDLKAGVLHIPRMNINSSLGFMEISGRQSLDMHMNYQIRIPLSLVTQVGFRSLFGGRSSQEVDPEQEDAIVFRDGNKKVRFLNINILGTPDNYRISLGRKRD